MSLILIAYVLVSHVPSVASAAAGQISNPLGNNATSIPVLVEKVLEGILKFGVPILALAFIYTGFLFVQAMGKPKELEVAKSAALTTVVGGGLFLGSVYLAKVLVNTVTALG